MLHQENLSQPNSTLFDSNTFSTPHKVQHILGHEPVKQALSGEIGSRYLDLEFEPQ